MRMLLPAAALVLAVGSAVPAAQPGDLDRLMERVLARRDENWKKLQQYVLAERETFDLSGAGGARLFGFRRDYSWFMRDGIFVRSPLRADGVTISEAERVRAESDWIRRERGRAERRRTADTDAPTSPTGSDEASQSADEPAREGSGAPSAALLAAEPAFVSWAYFLRFRFEPNRYALVGRETFDGRPALRIEYYPSELFKEGRTRPDRRLRERDAEVEEKMNKVSLVTLWIDREAQQVLQYTFDDIDMDFLPGRMLARVEDVKATMRMGTPFAGVWLPREIEMRFRMLLAAGPLEARYTVQYHDYRQADVTYKVR